MADLDEAERHEEILQKQEERLQRKHERLKEPHAGQAKSSSSLGSGLGDFMGGLAEHKFIIIGVIVVAIVAFLLIRGNSSSANNTANQQANPANAAGGYVPSDIGTSLDSINNALSGIGTTVSNLPGGPNGPAYPPPGTPPPPTSGPPRINIGQILPYSKITIGGVESNGMQRFWAAMPGNGTPQLFYLPQGSKINYGGSGRIWFTPPGGAQQLLTVSNSGGGQTPFSALQPNVGSLQPLNLRGVGQSSGVANAQSIVHA